MRITNSYMTNNMIRNLQNNLSQLAKVDEQMATTKRVLRLSDDPNIMGQLITVKNTLTYNEQYDKNIQDGLSYLDVADTAMGTLGDILAQAKAYANQGANDSYNAEDRQALAKQIDAIIDQVVDLGNATVGNKYIFAGKKSGSPPFERQGDKVIYNGDFSVIKRQVTAGHDYAINVPAVMPAADDNDFAFLDIEDDVTEFWSRDKNGMFGTIKLEDGQFVMDDGDPTNVFTALYDLRDALNDNDPEGIDQAMGNIEQSRDNMLQSRVELGARYTHFETLKGLLLDQEVSLTGELNNMEGADMAKLSIELSQKWLAYSASMASGSKLMQTSLLDYIR